MNTELHVAARCYELFDGEKAIGFMGVLHQPHGSAKNMKRVSRLVILPDYQGIGLGYLFLQAMAKIYHADGWDFRIVTSAKHMIQKLYKSGEWVMVRLDVSENHSPKSKLDFGRNTIRNACKTAGFKYKG